MNFGILVFDQVEELDFVGPWEMLTMWSKVAGGPASCLIVAQSARPVTCAKGLSINPHVSFADCPPPANFRDPRHGRGGRAAGLQAPPGRSAEIRWPSANFRTPTGHLLLP